MNCSFNIIYITQMLFRLLAFYILKLFVSFHIILIYVILEEVNYLFDFISEKLLKLPVVENTE